MLSSVRLAGPAGSTDDRGAFSDDHGGASESASESASERASVVTWASVVARG